MAISKSSLESLKDRVDLREIVGESIPLKRSGVSLTALCPFHDEKTPSFVVEADHYHCFGCGAHGDVFDFLAKTQGLDLPAAAEVLAKRYGLALEYTGQPGELSSQRKIFESLEAMTLLFHGLLLHTEEGEKALEYLSSRGIDLEMIRRFRLGLVPDMNTIEKVWTEKGNGLDLRKAGILPSFAGRIAVPLCDARGRVVGFSCRLWKKEGQPKYINSPETEVFKKSNLLFGLDHSRARIAKERQVILVEGQIDAMRLIGGGLAITVGLMGSSLSDAQCETLKRLGTKTAFVVLDGDPAGRTGAIKAGALLFGAGVEALIVNLPDGEDADRFVMSNGMAAFQTLLDQGVDWVTAAAAYFIARHGDTPIGRSRAAKEVLSLIDQWQDPVLIQESKRCLAGVLGLPETALGEPISFSTTNNPHRSGVASQVEIEALASVLGFGPNSKTSSIIFEALQESDFLNDRIRQAFALLRQRCGGNPSESIALLERAGLDDVVDMAETVTSWHGLSDLIVAIKRSCQQTHLVRLRRLLKIALDKQENPSALVSQIRDLEALLVDSN